MTSPPGGGTTASPSGRRAARPEDGSADARAKLGVELGLLHVLGDDPHDAVAEALDLDPEVGHELSIASTSRIAGTLG